jgi:hypothetical protein
MMAYLEEDITTTTIIITITTTTTIFLHYLHKLLTEKSETH